MLCWWSNTGPALTHKQLFNLSLAVQHVILTRPMSSAGGVPCPRTTRIDPSLTWTPRFRQVSKHGDSANQERDLVSTLDVWRGILADYSQACT